MMKLLFIIIVILSQFYFTLSLGQDKEIDSLKSLIPTLKNDTNKMNTLIRLNLWLGWRNPEEAVKYGEMAVELAEELYIKLRNELANGNTLFAPAYAEAMQQYISYKQREKVRKQLEAKK